MKKIFNILLLSIFLISSGMCLDVKERLIVSKKLFESIETKKIENVILSRSEDYSFIYKTKKYAFDRILLKTKYAGDIGKFTEEFKNEFEKSNTVIVRLFIISPVQNDDKTFDVTLHGMVFSKTKYTE